MRKLRKQSMKQGTAMMNMTTRRTEEERSNTMERKKWWASLIAVAVGLALSVGSASAIEQGDFAGRTGVIADNAADTGKLIPYYTAGENLATIIGVQNEATLATGSVSIIEVRVLDHIGGVQATGQLCLGANQFGYAVIEEMMMMDDMDMMDDMQVVLRVGAGGDEDVISGMTMTTSTGVMNRAGSVQDSTTTGTGIADMGYVVLHDLGHFTNAGVNQDPNSPTDDGCNSQGNATGNPYLDHSATDTSKFAAWAILQDVGSESFGTEIPVASVGTSGDPAPADPTTTTTVLDRIVCVAGTPTQCSGLVATPNDATADDPTPAEDATRTVTARIDNNMDNMSMSTVYVWMDASTPFDTTTGQRPMRMIDAMVYCEGGMPTPMKIDAPNRINMFYGSMFGCEARGTVNITLPAANATNGVDSGLVWSHVGQMGGGFRMNFPGVRELIITVSDG